MQIWEIVEDWPRGGWTVGPYPGYDEVTWRGDPGELRLEAFAGPDSNGWLNIVAVDRDLHEWSNLFRVKDTTQLACLEATLAKCIGRPLQEVGGVELSGMRHSSEQKTSPAAAAHGAGATSRTPVR